MNVSWKFFKRYWLTKHIFIYYLIKYDPFKMFQKVLKWTIRFRMNHKIILECSRNLNKSSRNLNQKFWIINHRKRDQRSKRKSLRILRQIITNWREIQKSNLGISNLITEVKFDISYWIPKIFQSLVENSQKF
jgi:hypothetical protein